MTSTNQKYHPWNAKAQSWEFIENSYITDWGGQHTQILKLVRYIKNSDYCKRIFGSTSMNKLVIGNCDPIDYRKRSTPYNF